MAANVPTLDEVRKRALKEFEREFGAPATVCACAPGRVNLIGEHVDYNEGFVLPMALPLVTVIAGRSNNLPLCRVQSLSESIGADGRAEFEPQSLKPGEPKWANYMKGCVHSFPCKVPGFDAVVLSTVPMGAGLSSSAALEVASYTFLEALTGTQLARKEDKALACQKAEHEFAGVPCGIMDQFISVMGEEGCSLLLDCRDLSTKQIPMAGLDEFVFLVTNSNAPHKLTSSAYRERRDCCFQVAKALQKKSLREATISDLEKLKQQGLPEQSLRYCRHVVMEIKRTQDAALALQSSDFKKFGQLMNESHDSLRDDYKVSSVELDSLVDAAREVEGVLGSRLTGAGFGGCTVTLVKKDSVERLIQHMCQMYSGKPTFYVAKPAAGARILPVHD